MSNIMFNIYTVFVFCLIILEIVLVVQPAFKNGLRQFMFSLLCLSITISLSILIIIFMDDIFNFVKSINLQLFTKYDIKEESFNASSSVATLTLCVLFQSWCFNIGLIEVIKANNKEGRYEWIKNIMKNN